MINDKRLLPQSTTSHQLAHANLILIIKRLLRPNEVVIMLDPQAGILPILAHARSHDLDLVRGPAVRGRPDAQADALDVVREVDEVEGANLLEHFILRPRAYRERQRARLDVGEARLAHPPFD